MGVGGGSIVWLVGAKLQANRAEMEISKNRLAQTMGSLLQHVDASDSKYCILLLVFTIVLMVGTCWTWPTSRLSGAATPRTR